MNQYKLDEALKTLYEIKDLKNDKNTKIRIQILISNIF